MKIQTSRFGEVEINEEACFEMISPILGYEEESKFVLIEHKEQSNFRWLQSAKTPDLAFVVTIAGLFGIDYTFEISDEDQELLQIVEVDDLLVLNIVVIPHENPRAATINLVAPLLFNIKTNKGGQFVLNDPKLKINHPLIQQGALC